VRKLNQNQYSKTPATFASGKIEASFVADAESRLSKATTRL
jgi:hypothetical protein